MMDREQEFVCRIADEDGEPVLKRVPVAQDESFVPRDFRREKIPQAERNLIWTYCVEQGETEHFPYLRDRAEQRALQFLKNYSGPFEAAARSLSDIPYTPVTKQLLAEWMNERTQPKLGDW